jgi:hypothetical protein
MLFSDSQQILPERSILNENKAHNEINQFTLTCNLH